jgi:hypothetical protein
VTDLAGNRWYSDPKPVVFDPDQPERRVEIAVLWVEGRAYLGDKPLAGTLWFGGKHGGQRARLESDEVGRFSGALPRREFYPVDVEPASGDELGMRWVEMTPVEQGRVELELRWPDTEIFGRVVTPGGQPVPGARLSLVHPWILRSYQTDRAGQFRIRGLPAEIHTLIARTAQKGVRLSSAPLLLDLGGSSKVGPLTLTLAAEASLEGRVVGSFGAVVGAEVEARPVGASGFLGASAVSGPEGRFSVSLPQHQGAWSVVVRAPGWPLQSFTVAPGATSLDLRLAAESGTLRLRLPEGGRPRGFVPLVWQGGAGLDLDRLPVGPTTEPGERAFEGLAPGLYRACWLDEREWAAWLVSNTLPGLGRCKDGILSHGGELTLTLEKP